MNPSHTYTKDEIMEAIRNELTASGHLGHGNENYYYINGIVAEALKRFDQKGRPLVSPSSPK